MDNIWGGMYPNHESSKNTAMLPGSIEYRTSGTINIAGRRARMCAATTYGAKKGLIVFCWNVFDFVF